uniref:Tetraspanin-1 n=1 Tax=Astyanax mexicanus TaxID=7994 RepID=A0A8B9KIC4_ASTMX
FYCIYYWACSTVPVFLQLGGLALAAVGIWLNAEGDSYVHILGIFSLDVVRFVNVGFFFIAIGGVMALLGFLGCWGAKKESKCLLIMFSSIILVIFISEVTTGAVMLTYSSLLESILKEWSTPVLKGQYGKDKVLTNMWNTTMTELHCCGFTNYTDFNDSYYYEENDGLYPPTCCTITEFLCDMNGALNSKIQVRKDSDKLIVLRTTALYFYCCTVLLCWSSSSLSSLVAGCCTEHIVSGLFSVSQ